MAFQRNVLVSASLRAPNSGLHLRSENRPARILAQEILEKACILVVVLGRFGVQKGQFGAENRLNSTKFDHGFEVVLLIRNGLGAILRPK